MTDYTAAPDGRKEGSNEGREEGRREWSDEGEMDRVKGGEVMKRKKCWSDCSKNHFDHVTDHVTHVWLQFDEKSFQSI